MPMRTLGTIQDPTERLRGEEPELVVGNAVRQDSASRMSASPARNSCFTSPWLLKSSARGGPEIVVTE